MGRENYADNPVPHYPLIDVPRFLLVSINIEAILQESTIHRRRERLNKMTEGLGLGHAYGTTIERIKALGGDKSQLGMEALMWISHAERPLRANELCHALAVKLGSPHFNPENVPSISTLVNCCQGLITVDKESIVRLIHFTLKEYLSAHPHIFRRPHSEIAEVCLTYLNSEQVKALSAAYPHNLETPFLGYCSRYWGVHAERDLSSHGRSLALELFRDYGGHISAQLLLEQVTYSGFRRQEMKFGFSGLHCASFFGIVDVVAVLIDLESYDINKGDFWGHTPLAWAAKHGHEGVVEILLGQAVVNPDKADIEGDTPLSHAARGGHEEVVKILLRQVGVDPDKPNNHGNTPLSLAAQCGHEEIVKTLLRQAKVDPDKTDNNGDTPLLRAAWRGCEGVVRVLLD